MCTLTASLSYSKIPVLKTFKLHILDCLQFSQYQVSSRIEFSLWLISKMYLVHLILNRKHCLFGSIDLPENWIRQLGLPVRQCRLTDMTDPDQYIRRVFRTFGDSGQDHFRINISQKYFTFLPNSVRFLIFSSETYLFRSGIHF